MIDSLWNSHPVAFWSGFTAFCGNIAGVKILDALGEQGQIGYQIAGAIVISVAVGGVAYGRERLAESKKEWKGKERRQRQMTPDEYKAQYEASEPTKEEP